MKHFDKWFFIAEYKYKVSNIRRVTKQYLVLGHFNVYIFGIQSESKPWLYKSKVKHLSFPVKHKVGIVGIFVQLPMEMFKAESILMQSYIYHRDLK